MRKEKVPTVGKGKNLNIAFKKVFTLVILLACWGVLVSCDDDEDDKIIRPEPAIPFIVFAAGEDSTTVGAAIITDIKTSGASLLQASSTAAEADKVAQDAATSLVCAVILEKDGFPSIVLFQDVDGNTSYTGASSVSDSIDNMLAALGDNTALEYQGYKFTLAKNSSDNEKLDVTVVPNLNIDYVLKIYQDTADCNYSTASKQPISMPAFEADANGSKASGVWLFKKGKKGTTKAESITISDFKIDLETEAKTPKELVTFLVDALNGSTFRKKIQPPTYQAYIAIKGEDASTCKYTGSDWKTGASGWACLALTKVLQGVGGNSLFPLFFTEKYTKAR